MTSLSDDELMAKLREVEVPEPSPLFWDHFSQRVHEAVAAEPAPSARWFGRLHWVWAGGGLAVVAVAALALGFSLRGTAPIASAPDSGYGMQSADNRGTAVPANLNDDASWAVMGELASEMDFDQANAAGFAVTPGSADIAVNQLSGDEQQTAIELLQQAIKNSKSL